MLVKNTNGSSFWKEHKDWWLDVGFLTFMSLIQKQSMVPDAKAFTLWNLLSGG